MIRESGTHVALLVSCRTNRICGGENGQSEMESAVKIEENYRISSVNLLSLPHFALYTYLLK